MKVCKVTNIGLVRKTNEDSLIAEDDLGLYGVADGMGGHQAGEIASCLAVQVLVNYFRQNPGSSGAGQTTLAAAVQEANYQVNARAKQQNNFRGMGTTITVGQFNGNQLQIAHVGDSRAYLLRNQQLTPLTADHSLVYELLQSGGISPEEAFSHPQRNILTRALGTAAEVAVDVADFTLVAGDRVLFCTDGLSGVVRAEEISTVLQQGDLTSAVDRLLELALERGGADNITIVLVEVE